MAEGTRRERWPDDRIDDLRIVVNDLLKVFGPLATQVARHEALVDEARDDIKRFPQDLRDTEKRLKAYIDKVEANLADQIKSSQQRVEGKTRNKVLVVVAVIGGIMTVLASLITAIAQIVT